MTDAAKLPAWLGWTRLAIGLAQGLALYWCDLTKDAPTPAHQAILFVALLAPLIVIGGLGATRLVTLGVWAVVATIAVFVIGWHDVARLGGDAEAVRNTFSGALLIAAIIVFVGHHLVQAADNARKWAAPYEDYFDLGWRHGAQLLLAALFTGAFWVILWLGAALFNLIKLDFLQQLLAHTWFSLPALCVSFAAAIHLTDLRSGLVRGVRALGLLLLSWLLPIMTGLAAAFLVALCFTGLKALWDTRAATSILLTAAAALVVLINATYQDGMKDGPPALVLAWSARIAGVLMTPIAILAAYALYLRVAQYGLTPERIFAMAVLLIGGCYAVTYLVAAFWPRWMRPLEVGNIASAYVVLIVAIALFTPLADPARLSVNDQVRRIQAGATPEAQIDWHFLRFDAARFGRDALGRLRADRTTARAQRLSALAANALQQQNRYDYAPPAPRQWRITMHPATLTAPRNLDQAARRAAYACARVSCDGFMIDVDDDATPELVVIDQAGSGVWVFAGDDAHGWRWIASGRLFSHWDRLRAGLVANDIRAVRPRLDDLMVGDAKILLEEQPAQ